jgi:superfamily II DNA or RNA helicase
VGAGKSDDSGRVVVATFQTVERMDWHTRFAFGKSFGLVIVDEAHHVPAASFNKVMLTMPARYRLGLTATPKRNDGLTDILHWHFGSILENIETADLAARGLVAKPRVEWMNTNWEGPSKHLEWPLFINKMTKNQDRNHQILERVERAAKDGRQILVLSDRVRHCEEMADALRQRGIKAEALVGKLSKTARAAILEATQSGEVRVLTATTIADEGLDLPSLDTVVLCTPTKAMGRVQQRVGRIMRPSASKQEPLIIDVVDQPRPMRGLANKRMKLYLKLGCTW